MKRKLKLIHSNVHYLIFKKNPNLKSICSIKKINFLKITILLKNKRN